MGWSSGTGGGGGGGGGLSTFNGDAGPAVVATLDSIATAEATAADVSLNSHKLTNVADPSAAQDAATKAYVDAVAQGLTVKRAVAVASTANLTLSGEQTIDGVLTSAARVLVKNQTTASENGVYVSAAGAWARAVDMDAGSEVPGAFVFVEAGTVNGSAGFVVAGAGPFTLGATAINWTQFSGAGEITNGTGISKSGNTLSIDTSVVVDKTTAQTLTNKTLTSPVVNTPTGIVKGDVGLSDVDNTSNATERAASATLTNKTLTSPVINTGVSGTAVDTDATMAANSDTNIPSQKAVKTALALKATLISPALVTPDLGTPSAGVLTNATGLPAAGVVGTALVATALDTDATFAANSDTRVPTQKAVNTALAPLLVQEKLLAGVVTQLGAFDRWRAGPGMPATFATGSLAANGTSLTITDAGILPFTVKSLVKVDDEVRFVTAGQNSTTLTLDANVVGQLGTTNTTHASGAPVKTRKERHIVWLGDSIFQGTNTGADPFIDRTIRDLGNKLGGHIGDHWPLWRDSAQSIDSSASEWVITGSHAVAVTTSAQCLSLYELLQVNGGTGNYVTWTRPAKERVQCIDVPWVDGGASWAAWSYSLDGGSTWTNNPVGSVYVARGNVYTLQVTRIRCDDPTSIIIRAANAAGTSEFFAMPYTGIVTWSSYPTFGKTGGIVNHNWGWEGQTLRAALNARTVADAVANGTTTITSATAAFVAGDAGSTVYVGAGGATAKTTIASVTNATTVVLNTSITTGSGITITIVQGDHTSDVLRVFDGDPGSVVPDLTVLWVSPNDMGGTNTAKGDNNPVAWQNMTQYIVDRIKTYSDVLIIAPYEIGGAGNSGSTAAYQALQQTYRTTAATLAAANGCMFLDLYNAFSLQGLTGYTAMNGAGMMYDTAHLAAKGQRFVGAGIAKMLTET